MCHEKKRLATDFVEHKELSQTCHVWTPGECRAGLNFAFYMRESILILLNFTYGVSVYGAVDSDLTVIQNFLDRCFKRKYVSKRIDVRGLLEKADRKLFKVHSVDPDSAR